MTVNEPDETETSTATELETVEASTEETAPDEQTADETRPGPAAPGPLQRALTYARAHRKAVALGAALLVSAIAAASVYWFVYRPDLLTNTEAQERVADSAKEATTALLSYAPDTIDKDLANAKSHLTGPFLTYYSDFTDKIVGPAAKQKGVKTEATVVRAAVSEMHPDKAIVLVFVNQVSTSKERPEPALASSSVVVTMVRRGDDWLISEFNPV